MNEQALKFYLFGEKAWEAMFAACAYAQETIELEQYIFSDDEIGKKFARVLIERAQAGVFIRVLCDAVGSWSLYNSRILHEMKAAGIEVRFINVVSPWRINNIFSWFFRDHRKILIVDRHVGFTGGIGIRDDMHDWRDTNVEVRGEIIREMLQTFEEMWAHAADRDIISRIKKASKYIRGFHFITNSPHFNKRFLYYQIVETIRSARSYIYITVPYFVPSPQFSRALRQAVRRGVDVRIVLPDRAVEPFVQRASHTHYEQLLSAGVKIFEYNRSFLHSKTIVVDDEWATVGSFNLDSLSFFYNYEANIVSVEKLFIEHLKRQFIDDLKNATEIKLETWRKRPLYQKFQELLVLPIRRFL